MITFDFDLDRAKAGDPVCMKDGTPVNILSYVSLARYPIQGECKRNWTNAGEYWENNDYGSHRDLRMKYPSTGNWIDWDGGYCPVDADAIVEIVFRDSDNIERFIRASDLYWLHSGYPSDIIAYKIIEEKKEMEKEYKRWKDMTTEEHKDLVYAYYIEKKKIEFRRDEHSKEWTICCPAWSPESFYRIAETKPEINWDHVHPDFNCLTDNSTEGALLHSHEPEMKNVEMKNAWILRGKCVDASSHASYKPGTCDWKDSLIKRPGVS